MSKVKFKYENGDLLRDKVSGLTGVVMVRAEYSTGCHHYGIQPRTLTKDGETKCWNWLDQSQLELVDKTVISFKVDNTATSGAFPSGPE